MPVSPCEPLPASGSRQVAPGGSTINAPRFREMVRQAGGERVAAGLHSRFDLEAGEALGRQAAALALARLVPALR